MVPQTSDKSVRLVLLAIIILFAGVILYVHHVTVTREAAVAAPQPTKYKNNIYGVSLEFPSDWQPVSSSTFNSYSGTSGFFTLAVSNSQETSVVTLAQKEASDTTHPYGSVPTTSTLIIDGQPAVLITPSSDQDISLRGRAELVVGYPTPVNISGQSYAYLILQADTVHISNIARSITFTKQN